MVLHSFSVDTIKHSPIAPCQRTRAFLQAREPRPRDRQSSSARPSCIRRRECLIDGDPLMPDDGRDMAGLVLRWVHESATWKVKA